MRRGTSIGFTCLAALVLVYMAFAPRLSHADTHAYRVVSEQTATGFAFPESVAYDPQAKVLYVGQFGSELKPTQKDGKGRSARWR